MISRLLLAGLLLAASPAVAQTSAPEPFTDSIDVRVVNVEAVVTDGHGERVRGLTAADFRLLVDGKEVPIDYFTEVADGEAAPAPASPGGAQPVAPVTGKVGRSVLVFVDQAFSIDAQLDFVLAQLEKEMGRLGPEDRVAVVSFSGSKLSVLTDWTGDPAAARAALAEARTGGVDGVAVRVERESLANDKALRDRVDVNRADLGDAAARGRELLAASLDPNGPQAATPGDFATARVVNDASNFPWQAATKLHRTMTAAIAALRGFADTPGRKTVLLLSGGWPVALQPQLFPQLIDTANRLGYTLYPVDVAGIESPPVPTSASVFGPTEPGQPNVSMVRSVWEFDTEYGLEKLAQWTGGKAALNSNRLVALDRLVEDTRSYYWIGFSPAWRGDGLRHAVRLEARPKGLAVRSRRSFTDLSRSAESAMEIEGRLLLGRDVQEKALFVELGSARRSGPREVEVPLTLGVPVEALSFVDTGGGAYQAELPLHITSFDSTQEALDLPPAVLRVVVLKLPPAGERMRFQSTIRLRRSEQRLRFVAQDAVHDKLLWGEGVVR